MDNIYLLLDKFKTRNNLKNCTILLGDETYYQDKVLKLYKELLFRETLNSNQESNIYHYEKINVENLEHFKENLYSGGFFSEVRLFIIRDSSIFTVKKHSEELLEKFLVIINDIPEDCYVIFIIDNLEKGLKNFKDYQKNKVYKDLEQRATCFSCIKPRYYEIKGWLTQEIKRRKLNFTKEAYESIWQYCNYTDNIALSILDNEFDKIALYTNPTETITRKKLLEISQLSMQVSVYRLVEYLQKKETNNVLGIWHELARENFPIEAIISPLAAQIKKIIHLKRAQENGMNLNDFAKEYKLSSYIVNKLITESVYLSIEELKELHNEMVEFLFSLRSGFKEYLDFQFILIKFCNR